MSINRTPEQLAKIKRTHEAIEDHQSILIKAAIWRTCLNCDNWRLTKLGNLCALYNVLPPPSVIVHGCQEHIDDIPF